MPYVIGSHDVLMVKVSGQPKLTGHVSVSSDGFISMPLAGQLLAEGLTAQQLRDSITDRLRERLKDPEVVVQIAKIYKTGMVFPSVH
jgi:polysaccharide export outer membrane protein